MTNSKITEAIFDVETQKWFDEVGENNHADLGISIVSVYSRVLNEKLEEIEGKIESFWENELTKLWPIFQQANRIIGFNSIGFDVPVLTPYTTFPIAKLPHFDIMAQVKESLGHRLSLDAIAKETLGRQKTETGAMSVEFWKRGDPKSLQRLKNYCEADVMLTRDIYDFGLKHGHLKYKDKWNTPRTVEINFSYPKEENNIQQEGLF